MRGCLEGEALGLELHRILVNLPLWSCSINQPRNRYLQLYWYIHNVPNDGNNELTWIFPPCIILTQ